MTEPRFKPYPAYKDSGIEWLGQIPEGWEVRRLKYLAQVNPEALPEDSDPGLELVYIDIGSLDGLGRISGLDHLMFASAPTRARRIVRNGDVIVSTVRTYLRAIAPISDPAPGTVASTGFAVIRPVADLVTDYAAYALRAPFFVERVVANSKGVSFPAINESEIATYDIPAPPKPEQHAIAAFLDRETERIDALVEKKERLIELLREQRSALITHAVTKGLDPDAPMKDSGVDWLGDIPAHWDAERIKWGAELVSGHTPDKKVDSYWLDGDIPWVSLADTGQLRRVDYLETTEVLTTLEGIANSSAHLLPANTVVFSRDATIGLAAIIDTAMAVSQHFIGWVCGSNLRPEYLLLVLRSMTQELERLTMGATVRTIGMPDVKSLASPVPPRREQEAIVERVLNERTRIDALITKVQEAIERLKEYRIALISAAVTGKINVREAV